MSCRSPTMMSGPVFAPQGAPVAMLNVPLKVWPAKKPPIWIRYVLPESTSKLTVDCAPQPSSLQASCVPAPGQPGPGYTASTVSIVAPPQSEISTVSATPAVHWNHTSQCAVGQLPVCCGLSVAPAVTTLNVPWPEMNVALTQSFAPCARAGALAST